MSYSDSGSDSLDDSKLTAQEDVWDFAIVSSISLSVLVFLTARTCQIHYQSAFKRNKLTFRINLWWVLTQVVVEVKSLAELLMSIYQVRQISFYRYALTAVQM